MKIAVLSLTVCQPTQRVIDFFLEKGLRPEIVIIEKAFRTRFSQNEKMYRNAHDRFNRKTRKYSFTRRLTRRIWDITPLPVRRFVLLNIYRLPMIRRFSIRRYCNAKGIESVELARHSSEETRKILEEASIDYALMVSSNWLLKEPVISIPGTKIINAHSGWLPKHKGLDSIGWSLLEGDPVGLSTHFIDATVDGGDILKFYEYEVREGDRFNDITRGIGSMQPFAFYDTLMGLAGKTILPVKQDREHQPHIPLTLEQLLDIESRLSSGN
jgi:folate-dependent phosphoribosylglycinamide formyltransferase PurN